jgi:hypothetical protein
MVRFLALAFLAAQNLSWLPNPQASVRGPIVVTGYSRTVLTGMNDPAEWSGFSRDGAHFGYCYEEPAGEPPLGIHCSVLDRAGGATLHSTNGAKGFDRQKKKELDAWLRETGLPRLPTKNKAPVAPKLEGSWDFASDIELRVDEHAQGKVGAMVRLGGSVRGEAPVFPVNVSRAPLGPGAPFHTSWVNALVLSPDGSEFGLVAGFFCGEYCNEFDARRIPAARLAAMIFNDTGMRHHQKADYAGSAALFTKAVHADPTFGLAAYNLACAFARTHDARWRDALDLAVQLGGSSVKERAKKDPDFGAVTP